MDVEQTIGKMMEGDVYSLAKIISSVESASENTGLIMQKVFPHCSGANVIGVTGSPGAGKSSVIFNLAKNLSEQGCKTAVLAIDPHSHITGGALLGDRIRMDDLKDVYIRSIGNRCSTGGLSSSAYFISKILEACKYEYIFIETVGAGQAEVKIKDLADTTLLVLAPGLGDDIQANKAGIMEIGDILIVNKADKPESERLKIQLKDMLNTSQRKNVNTPIFSTDCINGLGFDKLTNYIISMSLISNNTNKEISKLKVQYLELLENMIIEKLKYKIDNSENTKNVLADILQGELNIIDLINSEAKNVFPPKN